MGSCGHSLALWAHSPTQRPTLSLTATKKLSKMFHYVGLTGIMLQESFHCTHQQLEWSILQIQKGSIFIYIFL